MGFSAKIYLTDAGKSYLSQAQLGEELRFTKLVLGDGFLGAIPAEQIKTVIAPKLNTPIVEIKKADVGEIYVRGDITDVVNMPSFYFRELALMADKGAGTSEIIYGYGNAGNDAEIIEFNTSASTVSKIIAVSIVVDNAKNVTIDFGNSLAYALVSDFEKHKEDVETGAVVVGKAKDSEKLGGQLPAWYMPTGAIMPFAGTTAPAGFLMCNGHLVSRIDYANLFAVCGTLYGTGNGSTTFNLPNMGGRFALGAGGGYSQGSVGGASTSTLTEQQLPSLIEPVKSHPSINAGVTVNEGNRPGWQLAMYNTSTCAYYDEMFVSFGGNQTHNNMPPYLALNYIIKT